MEEVGWEECGSCKKVRGRWEVLQQGGRAVEWIEEEGWKRERGGSGRGEDGRLLCCINMEGEKGVGERWKGRCCFAAVAVEGEGRPKKRRAGWSVADEGRRKGGGRERCEAIWLNLLKNRFRSFAFCTPPPYVLVMALCPVK